ncbi:MAG: FecR/PupR family sigma factor regulator [Opitutaceae bacterium]
MNTASRSFSRDEPPRRGGTIEEQAADWLSRRDRGFLEGEQEAFSAWLLADPRHAAAANQIEASWRFLQKPWHSGQTEEVLREIEARVVVRTHRQRFLWRSASGLAAAVLLVFVLRPSRSPEVAPAVTANWM